jgi:hypothetical protein
VVGRLVLAARTGLGFGQSGLPDIQL